MMFEAEHPTMYRDCVFNPLHVRRATQSFSSGSILPLGDFARECIVYVGVPKPPTKAAKIASPPPPKPNCRDRMNFIRPRDPARYVGYTNNLCGFPPACAVFKFWMNLGFSTALDYIHCVYSDRVEWRAKIALSFWCASCQDKMFSVSNNAIPPQAIKFNILIFPKQIS